MSPSHSHAQLYTQPTFVELFTPKLVTVFREGYGWRDLRADAVSGLTVAVVALPLSMAIAIASGVSPERGLYTAIFGGLIISLIGGSRFQIGGPAGAFIGLVAGVVERHGYDGLALATVIAGLILIAVGLLRAGTYIKYIPFPVTVGFTAGIAVIIAASQIRDLFGLTIAHEPSALLPKLLAIRNALPTVHFPTLGIAILSVVLIVALRRLRPNWPSFLIAISIAAIVCAVFPLDVATVHSRCLEHGGKRRVLVIAAFITRRCRRAPGNFPADSFCRSHNRDRGRGRARRAAVPPSDGGKRRDS
jgi:SulP family sulfate permease